MGCRYPLREWSQRALPPGYAGPVFVSDIDKTYLTTRFSSLKGLARIPLEFAVDKKAVAGMTDILRGVRRGPGPEFASAPLYFVSSSPPQLRPVIARKMLLDGVQPDGFTFKDWGTTLRQLRPGRLKDHLGFKLAALLYGRRARQRAVEHLFGDDVERDAETYALYSSILSEEVSPSRLEAILVDAGVRDVDRWAIGDLLGSLPRPLGSVGSIHVLMVRSADPDNIETRWPTVRAVRDAFQLALSLFEQGLVDARCVEDARAGVQRGARLDDGELLRREEDAVRRGLVSPERVAEIAR